MKFVNTLWMSLIILLTLSACGGGSAVTAEIVSDAQISVHFEEEALAVGETTLFVTLTDSTGTPIDGATLSLHGDMDHQGMIPVIREVSHSAGGVYAVPFEWTMGGGWNVTVSVTLPDGGQVSETFHYFVEAASSESIINQHGGMGQGDSHDDDEATETPSH